MTETSARRGVVGGMDSRITVMPPVLSPAPSLPAAAVPAVPVLPALPVALSAVPAAAVPVLPALPVAVPAGAPARVPVASPAQTLFGLRVDALVLAEAAERCMRAVADRTPMEVGVVNAAKIVLMRSNRALSDAVAGVDLLLADGQSVVWASRFVGRPLPERVAGIDLFTTLLAAAEREDRSVYLLGATPEVLARTEAEVRRRHPDLRIAGSRDGYFPDDEATDVAEKVRASGADLLFLGMTSPKKELFCSAQAERTGAYVIHGVGGSFDVLAGVVRRAPRLWQAAGMEWLYRVLQEPRRLGPRYLRTNTRFVRLTLAERRHPAPAALVPAPRRPGPTEETS